MPRIEKTMLKGMQVSGLHVERSIADSEVEVTVLNDPQIFSRYVANIYDAISYRWLSDHVNGTPPVDAEEFLRYAITAVRTRVARVNNERFTSRCDDPWCLPAQLAVPINGIGRVTAERKIITINPAWNKALDPQLLGQQEQRRVTRRMKDMTEYQGSKFVMVDALAGQRDGDEILMSLVPVRDEHGAITELRSDYDIDPIAAAVYLICGLYPQALDGVALPSHPLLMSASYIRTAGVLAFLDTLAEVGT